MNILIKSLIVWLMLVAIPFQGFASASMLMCAPVQAAAPAMSMDHDHHAMMQAQHDGAAPAANHDATQHHHDGGKCNTCASCCFGAAMAPVGLPRLPAESPQLAAFHFEPGHVASVDLALPERPPQVSLT